jgi:hypothetical protein
MHIEPFSTGGAETARLLFATDGGAGDTTLNVSLIGMLLDEAIPTAGDNRYNGAVVDINFQLGVGDIVPSNGINNFLGFRLRGTLAASTLGIITENVTTSVSLPAAVQGYVTKLINFTSERMRSISVQLSAQNFGSTVIKEFIIYAKQIWQSRAM